MRSFDIVGYTFRAANYHPSCLLEVMPFGPGEAFDGWRVAPGVRMSVEENLDELAAAFSVNRGDESSFDSGDFPKVIFADSVEDGETCERCGEPLIEGEEPDTYLDRVDGHWYVVRYDPTLPQIHAPNCRTCAEESKR